MRSTLTATLTSLALLTACSSPEGGAARPGTSAAEGAEPTSTTSSSSRPSDIRLDGEDPCALATSERLAALGGTTGPRPGTSDTFNSPTCNFNTTGASWRITTVVTEGIEAWTSGERKGQASTTEPVAGYPAITVTLATDEASCDIAVDVTDGQYLYAGFQVSPSFADRFPKPCDGARQVAEAAMENLTG